MTFNEAEKLLKVAPRSNQSSRVNPFLSEDQAVTIVSDYVRGEIDKGKGDQPLDHLMEKRVHQVTRNQVRPRF